MDYNSLQMHAYCVLSDSGTVSEESAILRFPAITLRSSIERPEALDTGTIIMTDLRPQSVVAGIGAAFANHATTAIPTDYQPTDCSIRVRNFILSTAFEHAQWAGLR
jgi:UDP-N-acetylglucosamine 2-epimerase (non-hydrolysing)